MYHEYNKKNFENNAEPFISLKTYLVFHISKSTLSLIKSYYKLYRLQKYSLLNLVTYISELIVTSTDKSLI